MLNATYMARSDKARRELGWRPRPPQAGMLETFEWLAEQHAAPTHHKSIEKTVAQYTLIAALLLLLWWLLTRWGKKRQQP